MEVYTIPDEAVSTNQEPELSGPTPCWNRQHKPALGGGAEQYFGRANVTDGGGTQLVRKSAAVQAASIGSARH